MRSSNRKSLFGLALLLATLLASLPLSPTAGAATRRQRAEKAYKNAQEMRAALNSRPENARKKDDYEKLIRAFKLVHFCDPSYGKAPVALFYAGEVYGDMGRRFSKDEYYRSAIQAYRYLIEQYPGATLSRDALYTIAEIYRSDLDDAQKARQAYEDFVKHFPRTAQAKAAGEKIAQIDHQLAEEAAARAPKPEERPTTGLPEVTALRRWVGPSYTRIVINVEGEVKFNTTRLPHPDRIVLDLLNSRLSSALVGKTFPIENGFLRQVRVGQFQPTIARVVLDVEKIEDYSVFTLPNPFRLVIDINGPPPKAVEKTSLAQKKTTEPEATKAEAAEATKPAAPKTEASKGTAAVAEKQTAGGGPRGGKAAKGETAAAKTPAGKKTAEPAKATAVETAALPAKPPSPTEAGSRTLTRALGLKIGRIVIDPGHGGHDTGTIGPTGLMEKDVVLDVGLRLKKLIEEKTDAEVIMTRTDDTFIPLEERTAIANEKGADLFISIHANASRDRRARGIETYFLNFTSNPEALEVAARENATTQESVHQLQDLIKKIALTEKIEESQDFATHVQREVYKRLRKSTGAGKNRGVKKAPFVVLIGANMPSILAEISFLTNPHDERLLKKPAHRERIAEALYQGVEQYVDSVGGIKVAERGKDSAANSLSPQSAPASAANF